MSNSPVWVDSEAGRLRQVVIGQPLTFVLPEPINQKQRQWSEDPSLQPSRDRLIPEFMDFRDALESNGIEVIQPVAVEGVPDQLTPRDIGVVIADVFVRMRMATECRASEWRGIESFIRTLPAEHYLEVPAPAILEGGDVVVDGGHIFVGTGERSNVEGVAFLREHFGDRFDVHEVPLHGEAQGHDILHLDCAFVPLGNRKALIFPEGIAHMPAAMADRYDWIEVTHEEQQLLATNVLSLSPDTVISRSAAPRVNELLRSHGYNVVELVFAETPKSGGSFRCASLPLKRDPVN